MPNIQFSVFNFMNIDRCVSNFEYPEIDFYNGIVPSLTWKGPVGNLN